MQIFHTSQYTIQDHTITISDPRVVHQLTRVLRAKIGQKIMIQSMLENVTSRYECQIITLTSQHIQATIISTTKFHPSHISTQLIIAMSNRRDKMELIVQKATECGITHISIIPMHRSVIRQTNSNKRSRLESIMLESLEQSRRTHLPQLTRSDHWSDLTLSGTVYICDMGGIPVSELQKQSDTTLIIGPEGGLDPKDYDQLNKLTGVDLTTISLGSTILRMETAAIVGSWWMGQ